MIHRVVNRRKIGAGWILDVFLGYSRVHLQNLRMGAAVYLNLSFLPQCALLFS